MGVFERKGEVERKCKEKIWEKTVEAKRLDGEGGRARDHHKNEKHN